MGVSSGKLVCDCSPTQCIYIIPTFFDWASLVQSVFLNDTHVLSLSGRPTWSKLLPAGVPPAPRCQASACTVAGDLILIFGGASHAVDDEGDDKADHDDDDGDDDDGDGVGDDTSSVLLYRVLFWLCFCISQFSSSYC